jgi:hypothetical protein
VKIGPVLAIVALALIGLGSASAFQKEVEWASLRQSASSNDEPAVD